MDLFVSNDTVENFFFVNRGPGEGGHWNWDHFSCNPGLVQRKWRPRSEMGADAADLNGDDGRIPS